MSDNTAALQDSDTSNGEGQAIQALKQPTSDESATDDANIAGDPEKSQPETVAKPDNQPEDTQPELAENFEVPLRNGEADQADAHLNEGEVPPTAENANSDAAEPANEQPAEQADPNVISDDLTPLSDALRQKLAAIPWDVPPEVLNAVEKENEGGHFPFSDELHPEKFRETIQNMGGTYIGIGTDQSYVYMGWQRPTLAFAVDYDPWVVYIHHAYIAFFDQCEDSACLMAMFDDRMGSSEFLEKYYENNAEKKNIIKVFKTVSGNIRRQLGRLVAMKTPNFTNDPEIYQYIRTLVKSGRLVTLQANLLGDTALKAIAQTLRETGRTVTTFYTSNAEQYWAYKKAFKENMRAMPFADNALIMRTSATKPINNDYRYSVQPARVFLAWLDDPRGTMVKRVTKSVRPKDEEDFPFVYDDAMPDSN
ncbi:MAG: hypothetical protein J6A01_00760 [Proteobacteria bacterium]|nr:hypothetical protein [Pseudomonadota bacterium]